MSKKKAPGLKFLYLEKVWTFVINAASCEGESPTSSFEKQKHKFIS